MKLIIQTAFIALLFCTTVYQSNAQISAGGDPLSKHLSTRQVSLPTPPAIQAPALNLEKVYLKDNENPDNSRFAAPTHVSITMEEGVWSSLPDGGRVWRLKINVSDEKGFSILYDHFYLPEGAKLFVYTPDYQQILGAYTSVNNKPSERFVTGFIRGSSAIIEYHEPASQIGQGRFRIFRIDQVYHKEHFDASGSAPVRMPFGFGTAEDCHLNAECPEADGWETQRKSVCRIVMVLEEGTGYCTGTLINNTSEDETPYVLSAFHCQDGYTPFYDLWRFDFDYQSEGCADPLTEPLANSILGSTLRAGRQASDFLLLELSTAVPPVFDVTFAGWNREDTPPQEGVNFHHPSGDVKMVSLYDSAPVVHPSPITWNTDVTTPANHHFRLNYSVGSYEPGSSGSALFNQQGQVVGQLHGGINGECQGIPTVYFGRLSRSWEGGGTSDTRLKDWLDPLGTDADSMGSTAPATAAFVTVSGTVRNEAGTPLPNAQVIFVSPVSDTVMSDQNGFYSFSGVPNGLPLTFKVERSTSVQNGCSAFDLILIAQHSLGVNPLGSPYKILSADANGSGTITPLDQIAIRKVILGLALDFPGRPNWQFYPSTYPFTNPANPFIDQVLGNFTITGFNSDITLDFIGVKTGDMDDSAN
jgi:hypothetical protein